MQRMLIVKTGINRVVCLPDDRREWRGPPLRSNLTFAGVLLNSLTRHIYHDGHTGTKAWDFLVDGLLEDRKVARRALMYYPLISFVETPPTAALAQALVAMWWDGGTLRVTRNEAFLTVGTRRFGFDQRVVTHAGTQRRLPSRCALNPAALLAMPTGRSRLGTAEISALFRHLCAHFPDDAAALDVVFSAAVAGGVEMQRVLTDMFDIVSIESTHSHNSVWTEARRVVNSSVYNPAGELWQILKGMLRYEVFVAKFGNPHRAANTAYTQVLRTRHGAAIDEFERGMIDAEVFAQGGDASAALSLLKLQQMMGSAA